MKTDAWKRPLPSAVDDCANVTSGYEQQLSFNFGTQVRDATPQEADEWFNKKLLQVVNLAPNESMVEKIVDVHPMKQVAVMSVVQVLVFGFMLLSFYLISLFT